VTEAPPAGPGVGAEAPDFTLKSQDGERVSLSALRGGRAALVVFYPFAFSAICTGELTAVRDDLATFQNERVQVLAVSCDHPFALRAWADAQGFGFPLLSDFWPHGAVAQRYGVFNPTAGFALRGTFLVDRAGVVRFVEVNQPGEVRDQDGWRRALAAVEEVQRSKNVPGA
jgi:peroxiredoxin (alkyl hydroperoxide reductase subunit C)